MYTRLEKALENALDKVVEIDQAQEVKCEIRNCGRGLGIKEKYGRNICDRCEEQLIAN